MRKAELHRKDYESHKAHVISDIWFWLKSRDGEALNVMETKGIPALVLNTLDDQLSETIDEVIVRNNRVIAIASSYVDDVTEYDLEEFEIPMLITILESVEKHIELEDQEK